MNRADKTFSQELAEKGHVSLTNILAIDTAAGCQHHGKQQRNARESRRRSSQALTPENRKSRLALAVEERKELKPGKSPRLGKIK